MTHRLWIVPVLVALFLVGAKPLLAQSAADTQPADAKSAAALEEAKKFAGSWQLIGLTRDGEEVAEKEIQDVRLIFEGDQYTYKAENSQRNQGTFFADVSKKTPVIVTTRADGPGRGKTLRRIYEWVDADTVRFCSPGREEAVPDKFDAPRGSHRELAVWKRVKG